MDKLFAALRERHPGFSVVDVRFLVAQGDADGKTGPDLDEAFARSVFNAKRVDVEQAVT